MIKLIQQSQYLSLTQLENYELQDFSIITGLNGSGKTHLLKAINEGAVKIDTIDQSGIIYYTYNDFNIFYDDLKNNSDLKNKSDFFANKSSIFSQSLGGQRTTILSQYRIISENLSPSDYAILNSPDLINWSEEEIDAFEKQQLEIKDISLLEYHNSDFSAKQNSLINFIKKDFKTINIRQWLADKKSLIFKNQILNIIRNSNYSIEIVNWHDSQVQDYEIEKSENPNLQFHPMFGNGNSNYNHNFINFLHNVQTNPFLKDFELLTIKKAFYQVYEDLKNYFRNNISDTYLRLAIKVNGEEKLLDYITVDSGFLNLQEIAIAEKNYQIAKEQNQYNKFKATSQNEEIHFFSEEEFFKSHGSSPVTLLNEVLNEYDCNGYEFRESQLNFYLGADLNNQNVRISLYNKSGNYTTTLDAISSGEKTLIALSFYLYKLQKRKIITNLLLLDEIDSALHPSMSKRLLDVLYNIFYKKMGIKIIISTHSPSTVALAPKESIFVMDKYSVPKITKVSKDKALKELTFGVPSFSVNYENRRQVFVESENDVAFYEDLYNIYNPHLNPEISLNFISSGDSRTDKNGVSISNCDQVIRISKTLREAGNNFIWGIIDWDLNLNEPDEKYIKVLGFKKRYSIENYLLDPLLLSILLWHERILNANDFGLEDKKFTNIINFESEELQKMTNKVISDINKHIGEQNNDLVESILLNDFKITLPKWYCEIQGHKLEEIIIKTYPALNRIKKKEPDLKLAVIEKVIYDFPHFIPVELLNIFKSIQEE